MGQSASQNESSFPESGVSIGTDASGESIPVPFNELDLYQQQGLMSIILIACIAKLKYLILKVKIHPFY